MKMELWKILICTSIDDHPIAALLQLQFANQVLDGFNQVEQEIRIIGIKTQQGRHSFFGDDQYMHRITGFGVVDRRSGLSFFQNVLQG